MRGAGVTSFGRFWECVLCGGNATLLGVPYKKNTSHPFGVQQMALGLRYAHGMSFNAGLGRGVFFELWPHAWCVKSNT